jgi:hypothetical protein
LVVPHLRLLDDANSSSGRQRPCCTGRKLAGADLMPQAPWALQSRRAGIEDDGAKAALVASAVCAPSVAVAKSASAFSAAGLIIRIDCMLVSLNLHDCFRVPSLRLTAQKLEQVKKQGTSYKNNP